MQRGAGALWRLTLTQIVEGLREGRYTCAEIMRAHLTRCAALEPAVQAWEHFDAERAIAAAESADARLRSGAPVRALEGVPVGIKDIIDVAGMPTRMGSPIMADNVARTTAECVARLEAAGAIVLGKTVTTEFAYYTPGKTRNPWNAAHTPGGSSSGSAAAVACGMIAGALGTQTNGSVIRPAAFCGVVGYKPSFGAVPNHGTLDPWPSLDHTGVFARTVADAAQLAAVVTAGAIPPDISPLALPRFAAVRSPVWNLAEPAQEQSFARAIDSLRAAGATVDERELPAAFNEAHTATRTLMAYEARAHFGKLRDDRGDAMSAQLKALIDEGAGITEEKYRDALALQGRLKTQFAAYVAAFDAVITPPAPGEAPNTLEQTGSPAFCTIWSLLGVPAITVPVELGPGGMPLGLQITAAFGAERVALSAALWCERVFAFAPLTARERE
ncbi:MAG TPA: amidase [Burkholderiales bacterium]|nr:amidase [Burkholderiales bacterium]